MKINKFLIAGAAVAIMSLNVQAQEAPTNNQQQINPTVAKTLSSVGGFFGSLVQGAKAVVHTTADGVKTIANSEGAQNIKNGVVKGAKVVSETASEVANSEVGQTVKDGAVKGAKFVANTASDGAKAVSSGYKEATQNQNKSEEPTVEAASVTPVSQPTSTPSLSEGISSAKDKIGNMISFLRDKATKSSDNTNDDTKIKP